MSVRIDMKATWTEKSSMVVERCSRQALRVGPLFLPGFRDVRHPPPIWIAVKCPSGSRLILQDGGMKAMTWSKVGGGVLVALAAFAAAGTHYADVTGSAPVNPE